MLIWNVLVTWFLLVVSAAAFSPSLFESHCPVCGGVLHAYGRLEFLCQIGVFGGDQTVFLVFMAIMVVGGIVVFLLGPETRGRSLEELGAT